jgi:hypothetical protein
MRVNIRHRLVKRNRQIAQYLFFFSFGMLILGLLVINAPGMGGQGEGTSLFFGLSSLILPAAFISTMVSVRMTNLWVRVPRPEKVIPEHLKGIYNKSVFYSYYHFPARHVLISPQGVFAIVTRYQEGRFIVRGEQWQAVRSPLARLLSILRFDGIGNPTRDAQKAAAHVQSLLAPIAPGVQVRPLIIFTDPRAQVDAEDTPVEVVFVSNKQAPSFRELLRTLQRSGVNAMPLTPDQIAAFEAASQVEDEA